MTLVTTTRAVILAIFVLSGAAGLVYEIVWSRQLVIVFGNTTQAVSTILTGFFGGMAVGAWIGGRIADRVRSPLRFYGLLELLVALVAIATPLTFHTLHELYRGAYPALADQPGALGLVRFGLAVAALAPATVLMGATLPSLTRYLSSTSGGLSGAFGRLYAANIAGAILGTALAGLVLIELLGLTGTLLIGAMCSALAGLAALALDRRGLEPGDVALSTGEATASTPSMEPLHPTFRPGPPHPRLALAIAFASGLTSLAYQVLWVRLISSGSGNATYVFTLILVLFLGGLAWGAMSVARGRFSRRDPLAVVAVSQILVGALALGGLLVIALIPTLPWMVTALIVVLPTALVMGIAFPASSALLADREGHTAEETGGLLAINTSGAIVGTFLVPFVVVPAVGSPAAVALIAVGNAALGAALAWQVRAGRRPWGESLVAVAVVVAVIGCLGFSVIRDPSVARIEAAGGVVFDTREDEIAPVQAGRIRTSQQLWVSGTSMTVLTVDARLMPVLSLMLRPDAERALVIAFGMGSAYRSGLIAGLDVEAVELVPTVPDMFGWFYPDAESVLEDPSGRIVIADGRNHVELTRQRYDIVIVDPPPPIESAGVSVISSLDFYLASKARLDAGGLMMQWVPFGQTVDEFRSHVRTFRDVFANVIVAIGPGGNGTFMFGSDDPLAFDPAAVRGVLDRPGVLADISSARDSPAATASEWAAIVPSLVWAEGASVASFAGPGPLITDDRPLPEYYALRRAFGPRSAYLSSAASLRAIDPATSRP